MILNFIQIYTSPLHELEVVQGNFSGILQVWIQSFPFFWTDRPTKLKSPICILLTHCFRKNRSMHLFLKVFTIPIALIGSFKIWKQVAVSFSYDDCHYSTSATRTVYKNEASVLEIWKVLSPHLLPLLSCSLWPWILYLLWVK